MDPYTLSWRVFNTTVFTNYSSEDAYVYSFTNNTLRFLTNENKTIKLKFFTQRIYTCYLHNNYIKNLYFGA